VLLIGLAVFYHAAATEHARVQNTSRVRADQSGYLWDAVGVHGNWWNDDPDVLIGERNRMPLYPGFLALFYDPALSPEEFFARGKRLNILLSIVLLAVLFAIFARHLPGLVATNLLLIVAFGYFVFKAGYVQTELLFYFLVFVTFLTLAHLLEARSRAAGLGLAALGGVLAALAHLAKASMLPLVAIFLLVFGVRELARLVRSHPDPGGGRRALARFGWRAAAGVVFLACFLGALSPYITTSKRVYGQYFYNVNTTFYMWYDDWPSASVGTYSHGDAVGWPTLPADQIPSARTYWRDHTLRQIGARLADGYWEMVTISYQRFWYMKYVALYVAFAGLLMVTCRRPFARLVCEHGALFAFMLLYGVAYLTAIAFYRPISGSTSRMLLAHLAPLLFVLSCFFVRPPFRDVQWRAAGIPVTPGHFHLLVLATIALDLVFTLPPRLMESFAGY
jgi:hypothetical protein